VTTRDQVPPELQDEIYRPGEDEIFNKDIIFENPEGFGEPE